MPFEDDFSDALRAAADASPAPAVELLAAGAQQRGKRKKLRRTLVASVATVAVVAGGGVLATQLRPIPADRQSIASAAVAPSSASASPAADTTAEPVTAAQMLTLLKQQLPTGLQLDAVRSQGATPEPDVKADGPFADYAVTDARGKGEVSINVQHLAAPLNLTLKSLTCQEGALKDGNSCTRTALAGGAYLRLLKNNMTMADGTVMAWQAQLQRPDGILVTAESWNTSPSNPTPTRAEPPLSTEQLGTLVQAPVWLTAAAGVHTDVSAVDPQAHTWLPVPVADILRTAAPLLPSGLTELQPGGEDSFATFLVDDGHGRSLVRVNVEDWSVYQKEKFNGGDISDEFTKAEVLPDGTKVIAETQDPFGPYQGVVDSEVSVLRADKLLIRVESFNGTDFKGSVTRSRPALTLDQLKAIALSPSWHGPAAASVTSAAPAAAPTRPAAASG
jgi:hypothetical protein